MYRIKNYFNKWSLLVFIAVIAFLCLLAVFISFLVRNNSSVSNMPTASFVVIPAPTFTSTPDPVLSATQGAENEIRDGIRIGSVIQIHGTDGAGLRLRSGPGTDYGIKFIGLDSEIYEVEDGPVDADGYVWWYLVSPYDTNRSGWAASSYLSLVTGN